MAVLVRKGSPAGKQEPVYVLRQPLVFAQEVPIVCDASEDHVAFQQLGLCHDKSLRLGEAFAFTEIEGPEVDVARKTVVQSSDVAVNLPDDPRRRRSADDQHNVLAHRAPSVPEVVERRKKIRSGGVHPRAFVKKDDLLSSRLVLQQFRQLLECLAPVLQRSSALVPVSMERFRKRLD